MSEPDDPRWLAEISPELRKEVAVRPAWRARLLEDIAHTRKPFDGDTYDDRDDDVVDAPAARTRSRRIVIRPWTAAAAAVAFAVLGAGTTLATLSWRDRVATPNDGIVARESSSSTSRVANIDREVVRFELAAPSASRVALVGSFNEWNPVATPLTRDVSGKWVVAVQLPRGRHVYAFVVDGDVTADPDAPRAADDDFGSPNSVVLVGRS
jgi:hypothetical protein